MSVNEMKEQTAKTIIPELPLDGKFDPDNWYLYSPTEYLNLLRKDGHDNIAGYIMINMGNETEEFKSEVELLETDETIDLLMLFGWVIDGLEIIGQSIDGDYLAGTNKQTMIIPEDMHREDIEFYDMDVPHFLYKYLMGEIESKIFPKLDILPH